MDYTLENATQLAEELRAIPPKDPAQRKLDKQGMVSILAQEIIALQQRGYTIEEVADSLRGRGLEITTPTLKSYLQRVKARTEQRPKSGRRTARKSVKPGQPTALGLSNAAVDPPTASVAAIAKAPGAPPATSETAPLRSGKNAFLIKDKDSY